MKISKKPRTARAFIAAVFVLAARRAPGYDWLQYNGDSQHSGNNTQEIFISSVNVASLGILFKVTLPSPADGAPAYLSAVNTAAGLKDLLFVTSFDGTLSAIDAHTGGTVWFAPHPGAAFTTSSPAIDLNRQFVYGYGLDGFVHKHQVADGTEVTTGGWPELISLKPSLEKGSSALSWATARSGHTYLYCTSASTGNETTDYQGHVTAIDLSDGTQNVFNGLCSDQTVHFTLGGSPDCADIGAGIWGRPGVIYEPLSDRILMVTGNGNFNGNTGGSDWGDTAFFLHPDGTGSGGKPLDSYTPVDFQQLQNVDEDLGSKAPALLPTLAGSIYPHIAALGGKDGVLRLLNLDNLSGAGGPGNVGGEIEVQTDAPPGPNATQPAVWVNPADGSTWLFISSGAGINAYKLVLAAGNLPHLSPQWSLPLNGFSPLVANNVLYYAATHRLSALDPATGTALWTDAQIGTIHWESPVVANGVLYVSDSDGHLSAYTPGAQNPGALLASPSGPLLFQKTLSGPDPAPQTITVTNYGNSSATVTVAASAGWVTALPQSFPLAGGASQPVTVSVTDSGSCTSQADVTISAPGVGNSPLSVPLELDVLLPSTPAHYYTIAPCRLIDTRGGDPGVPYGPPSLAGGGATVDYVAEGFCGIPAGATALCVNITVTNASNSGDLRLFPSGSCVPGASAINFNAHSVRANNVIVPLLTSGPQTGSLRVESDIFPGTADLILDISGYFE